MTNADKYLKDGVEHIESLIQEYFHFIGCVEDSDRYNSIYQFFLNEAKPTLTEDERVILRNIDKKYKVLEKENGELRISTGRPSYNFHLFTEFQHLFQFIKERRRISN